MIGGLLMLLVATTPEPGHATVALEPGQAKAWRLPAGSLWALRGAPNGLAIWQRQAEVGGVALEVELPLFEHGELRLVQVPPLGAGLLLIESPVEVELSVWRADSAALWRRPQAWAALAEALATWAETGPAQPPPVPWWADAPLRADLAALAAVAEAAGGNRRAIDAAVEALLRQHEPFLPPRYVRHRVPLGEAADGRLRLAAGRRGGWRAHADGVAHLRLRSRGELCARGSLSWAGRAPQAFWLGCADKLAGRTNGAALPPAGDAEEELIWLADTATQQRALSAGEEWLVAVDEGELELELEWAERRRRLDELCPFAGERPSAQDGAPRGAAPVRSSATELGAEQRQSPERFDLARDLRRRDRALGVWRALPLPAEQRVTRLVPVSRAAGRLQWTRLSPTPTEIVVPADPLALGRLRRLRVRAEPASETEALAQLTIDDRRFSLPLARQQREDAFYLAPGRHAVSATGAAIWLEAEVVDEAGAAYAARDFTPLAEGAPLRLPLAGGPSSLRLELLPASAPAWESVLPAIAVCFAARCTSLRLRALTEERGEAEILIAQLEVPAGATAVELHLHGAGSWWVRPSQRQERADQPATLAFAAPPPLSATELAAARAALDRAVAEDPSALRPRVERAELWARLGELGPARAELEQLAEHDQRSRALLAALGPKGQWRRAASGESVVPVEGVWLVSPGAAEQAALAAAVVELRREPSAGRAALAELVAAGPQQAPLSTWLLAEELATEDAPAAQALFEQLAAHQIAPEYAYLRAGELAAELSDEEAVALGYAAALSAGQAPGAVTLREKLASRRAWLSIPVVETSDGSAILERESDTGSVSSLWWRSSPRRPVALTVLGPTVLRLRLRATLAADRSPIVRLRIGAAPVQSFELSAGPEPAAGAPGRPAELSAEQTLQVPVLARGAQSVSIESDGGELFVRLAVAGPAVAVQPEAAAAEPASSGAEQSGEEVAASPPALSSSPVRVAGLAPPPPTAAFTLRLISSVATRDREEEDSHALAEPFVGLALEAHRRMGPRLWLSGGPLVKLRPTAPGTAGLRGRFDYGGRGLRLELLTVGYVQQLGPTQAFGARLQGEVGYQQRLWSWLDARAGLGYVVRHSSLHEMPSGARRVDPAVFSTFAADHPFEPSLNFYLSSRPLVDLWAQTYLGVAANADHRTLDRVSAGGAVWVVVPPFYGQLDYLHRRYLPDEERFLPYSLDRFQARLGMACWQSAAWRWRVEIRQRLALRELNAETLISLAVEQVGGRGVEDFSPMLLPLRSVWQAAAPWGEEP